MTIRFATNKTKLAQCLGISRTLLYEFMRLPDAPAPCADGRWSVSAFRKFIAKKRDSVKASEKEQLQILCLKIKAEREQHELDVALGEVEAQIHKKYGDILCRDHEILSSGLRRMVAELAPRFEGLTARQIHGLWKERLDLCFAEFQRAFEEADEKAKRESPSQRTMAGPRPKKIIQFGVKKIAAAAG
jgi:hypothetical protein